MEVPQVKLVGGSEASLSNVCAAPGPPIRSALRSDVVAAMFTLHHKISAAYLNGHSLQLAPKILRGVIILVLRWRRLCRGYSYNERRFRGSRLVHYYSSYRSMLRSNKIERSKEGPTRVGAPALKEIALPGMINWSSGNLYDLWAVLKGSWRTALSAFEGVR